MPAASRPTLASFSDRTSEACAFSSSSFFAFARSSCAFAAASLATRLSVIARKLLPSVSSSRAPPVGIVSSRPPAATFSAASARASTGRTTSRCIA
jgi:hypothetical protein